MSSSQNHLTDRYTAALSAYVAAHEESALLQSYELGREAITQGLGVLDIIALHQEVIEGVLRGTRRSEEMKGTTKAANEFLAEVLGPFEMIQRGFREASESLWELNQTLEEQVGQRTRELAGSDARKSAMLESALDAIVSMDHEGKIVEFNPAAEEMFGYSRADVIGKPMAETIIPPSLRDQHQRGLANYLATGEGRVIGTRVELTGLRSNVEQFPVELTITRVDLPGPPLFIGFIRDITERKNSEKQLQQGIEALERAGEERRTLLAHIVRAQEEERRRIASDIHDDSIQAMAAVGLRLGMLKARLENPDQVAGLAKLEEDVQRAIGRLRHLLFQLSPPSLEREGLAEAIRTYIEEAFAESQVMGRVESLLVSEPSKEVRTLIYRIVQEALSNVRKHAQARNVAVNIDQRNGGLLIRVRDDGLGFTSEEAEANLPGHFGMVSMRERAEMLGGWFKVEGVPSVGTTVEFWVPIES